MSPPHSSRGPQSPLRLGSRSPASPQLLQSRHSHEDEVKPFLLLLSCIWGPGRRASAVPPLLPSPPCRLSRQLEPAPRRHLVRIKSAPSAFSVIICVAKLPPFFVFAFFSLCKNPHAELGDPLPAPRALCELQQPRDAPMTSESSATAECCHMSREAPAAPAGTELAKGRPSVRPSARAGSPPNSSHGVWECRDALASPSRRT